MKRLPIITVYYMISYYYKHVLSRCPGSSFLQVVFGTPWCRWTYLVDDVDSVVQLLPLQDGVQVVQPELQVFVSFAERDDDGHLLQRHAV